ncbi:MAG: hemolysin III [Candidatus Promineifilaceae bacterium]|jgi:hemolysin III
MKEDEHSIQSTKKQRFWDAMNTRLEEYTVGEEIAHGITHGIGTGLAIAGLTLLVVIGVNQGDLRHVLAFSIYGATLVLLYLASTLYHSLQFKSLRQPLKIIDHAGIYLLIAGTYTPFMILGVGTPAGYTVLGVVWGLAVIGIVLKVFFVNRFVIASTAGYVLMGWLSVFVWNQLVAQVPPQAVGLLVAGGVSYTAGVIFFALDRMPYNHAVWHLFVLGGSFCHFFAMFYLV